jgi:hypothetical protein
MHKILLKGPSYLCGLADSGGQQHRNSGATAQLALDRHPAPMLFHDLLHKA